VFEVCLELCVSALKGGYFFLYVRHSSLESFYLCLKCDSLVLLRTKIPFRVVETRQQPGAFGVRLARRIVTKILKE